MTQAFVLLSKAASQLLFYVLAKQSTNPMICTHLIERGSLLLHFHDYLLSCVFAAIWQKLKGGPHRLQSNQRKTRKIFLPQPGIEPMIF